MYKSYFQTFNLFCLTFTKVKTHVRTTRPAAAEYLRKIYTAGYMSEGKTKIPQAAGFLFSEIPPLVTRGLYLLWIKC